MSTLMIISTENGSQYYSLFYMLAFAVAGCIFIFHGIRKGYQKKTCFLIALMAVIFFILGNKIFTLSPIDWKMLFTESRLPDNSGRSVLGGILGVIIGIFITKFLLRYKFPVFDLLAYALPVAMAITRIGCLNAGCCFGTPTDLAWGIQYDNASFAHMVHQGDGMINAFSGTSLRVHPTPIYDMIFCLLTFILVWITAKRWKRPGSLFLVSVVSYTFFRFLQEFLRDPTLCGLAGEVSMGLKNIQWILILAITIMLGILIMRESGRAIKTRKNPITNTNRLHEFLIISFALTVLIISWEWFDIFEKTVIILFLFPISCSFIYGIYYRFTMPALRWSLPLLLLAVVLVMGQTNRIPRGSKKTHTELSVGAMLGKYFKDARMVNQITGQGLMGGTCFDGGPSASHKYNFYVVGMDISHNERYNQYRKFKGGIGLFFGLEKEKRETGEYTKEYPIVGIKPYFQYDGRWIGFGLGLNAGKLRYSSLSKDVEEGEYTGDTEDFIIMPQVNLRLGPYDIFYLKTSFADHSPSSCPLPTIKAGIGSGLGKTNGLDIGIGALTMEDDWGFYGNISYPINDKYLVEAFYGDKFESETSGGVIASFGFKYRFNYKTQKRVNIKKSRK